MNRIEHLKKLKAQAAEIERKNKLRRDLTGKEDAPKKISSKAAEALAQALHGLLNEK